METGQVGAARKLPGMMDTLDNSPLFFFLPVFTRHQLSLKALSITPTSPTTRTPHPPPHCLSNELFSSGDGTGTQSNLINNLLFSLTN